MLFLYEDESLQHKERDEMLGAVIFLSHVAKFTEKISTVSVVEWYNQCLPYYILYWARVRFPADTFSFLLPFR